MDSVARAADDGFAIYSPASAIERLDRGFPLRLYQRLFWGRPRPIRPEPVPEEIDAGDFGTLRTLAAPGHSDDMTCYLEAERGFLFTGDLYLSSKVKYLRADEDLRAQIASLRRILELDFGTVFCSHRGVVASGKEALRRKLDFLESLRGRVRHLHGEGRSVREITRLVLGREGLLPWMTGFHFSKRNLIEACLDDWD
jgi:glyoxylase-like metal-dependent hydrolase (beta-lactamase superfamily II)